MNEEVLKGFIIKYIWCVCVCFKSSYKFPPFKLVHRKLKTPEV